MSKTFTVTQKPSFMNSPKNEGTDGLPFNVFEDSDSNRVSKWAAAYAFQQWNLGDEVSFEELEEQLSIAHTQQLLDALIEKGYMEALMPEDMSSEVTYRLTSYGKEHMKKLR